MSTNINQTNPKKQDDNKVIILASLLGLLFLTNIFFLYKWISTSKSKGNQITELTQENTELEADYTSAIAELEGIKVELESSKGVNAELDSIIAIREQEINDKQAYIKKLQSTGSANKNVITQLNAEIAGFKAQMAKDRSVIDSLFKVSGQLQMDKDQLTQEKQVLSTELQEEKIVTQQLNVDKKFLSSKYELGKLLPVNNVVVTGIKEKKGGEKEAETNKASRMDKLKIQFNTGNNKVNDDEKITTYLRLVRPDGGLVTGTSSGEFKLADEGGRKLNYTVPAAFNYAQKDKVVEVYLSNTTFAPGSYTLEIYQDGYMIGGSKFALK